MSEPDSPPPRTPVVAVVGTCEESTGSFLSLLVRGDADVDRPMPAPGEVLRWTLDTKYYVADAACVFHPLPGAYLDALALVGSRALLVCAPRPHGTRHVLCPMVDLAK